MDKRKQKIWKRIGDIFNVLLLNISEILILAKLTCLFHAISVKILEDIYIFEETGKLIVKFIKQKTLANLCDHDKGES